MDFSPLVFLAAMNTPVFTVDDNWRRTPSSESADVDIEAETVIGTRAPSVLSTRPSQNDSPRGEHLPPPYADLELPTYSADSNTEPTTLAMYLFKFGFLFPPLWILGAIILIFPLSSRANLEHSKSEAERQQIIQIIRDTERRWARRCVSALIALLALAGIAGSIALAVCYSR